MISVEEALGRVLALVAPVGTETVALADAAGRVLRAPARARRDQPPFAGSAMDGYALAPGSHAEGERLRVIGESGAGHRFGGGLGPGEAVRIFTGAPVPEGADRVVIQENVTREGDEITLVVAPPAGANIRPAGGDFRSGDTLAAPRRLRAADLALLAAMNHAAPEVARRPEIALIATGDELVMPGETPGPDQIIASNAFALKAMIETAGGRARMLPIARDSDEALRAVFALAEGADMIVTIGGASVGDHDLVGKVAAALGLDRAFYKIAMRPGKPLMAGRMMGVPMLGLPGNPVSAIVCAHLFVLPALDALLGLEAGPRPLGRARLGCDLPANGPRAHYMRAQLEAGNDMARIVPFDAQDSALLSILTKADALLLRPVDAPAAAAGSMVPYLAI